MTGAMDAERSFLSNSGETGAAIRELDWSQTPLGPVEMWPTVLKTTLRLLMHSSCPMFLWWGPQLIQFYNDAFRRCLGADSAAPTLGQCGGSGWEVSWKVMAPEVRAVLAGGKASWHQNRPIPIMHKGRLSSISWTYGLSPVEDEEGIQGVLALGAAITPEYLAEQHLKCTYQTLQEWMEEGFCICEILRDEKGKACDWRYLEANAAFEKQSGLKNVIGKTFKELVPSRNHQFLHLFAQVAMTGKPARFVEESACLGRWFEGLVVRIGVPGSWCIGVLFRDISRQKAAEHALQSSEERFRLLTQLSSDGILVKVEERFVYANRGAARILGADDEQALIDRTLYELIDPESCEALAPLDDSESDAVPIQLVEQCWRRVDGSPVIVQMTAGRVNWDGRPAMQILLRDVSDRKRSQEHMHIINERLKLAIEGSGEGFWDWDLRANITSYSERICEITGYSLEELQSGREFWISRLHPNDRERVLATLHEHLEGKSFCYSCEFRIRGKRGRWIWVHSRGVLVERSRDGEPWRMTGLMADITQRKEMDERMWHLANFDALTGLPNRRLFRDRLAHEVANAQRRNSTFALLFIDLDRFKQVNDFFGHDAGDALLYQASLRIRQCVRDSDTVARLGGDEFTIIFSDLYNTDHIERLVQKLLDILAVPFSMGSEKAFLTASIGIAVYPHDASSAEELIRKADQAMYAAKNAGKNQFSYFTREMDQKAHWRLRLLQELRHAVHAGEIHVLYQPVIDLSTGQIIKAEALVRWNNSLLGAVNPAAFIPIAEEAGMIGVIGDYVFRTAADTAKRWSMTLGLPLQVSVNKSPLQFRSKEQEKWLSYLKKLQLSPDHIAIEITEGLLLDISDHVSSKLMEYKDAGIQVAIDDFGTGYSSMAYLQKFSIDYLKIDQSFVCDMASNPGNRSITESMIAMAHKLGLKVIAEGVETQDQMDILKAAGCDYGQGFLFSQPLPADEFESLLIQRNQDYRGPPLY